MEYFKILHINARRTRRKFGQLISWAGLWKWLLRTFWEYLWILKIRNHVHRTLIPVLNEKNLVRISYFLTVRFNIVKFSLEYPKRSLFFTPSHQNPVCLFLRAYHIPRQAYSPWFVYPNRGYLARSTKHEAPHCVIFLNLLCASKCLLQHPVTRFFPVMWKTKSDTHANQAWLWFCIL